jgi:hypothetical protein
MTEAEQVGLLFKWPAQPVYVELTAVVILSIGPAIRRSATVMQFRGTGHKLVLTAVQRVKEWL